jgi:arginase
VATLSPAGAGPSYLAAIRDSCIEIATRLSGLDEEIFPIVLGGDHSVAMGTVPGAARGGVTGLVWVDAHADMNTPATTPSGNVHGMPLAQLLGDAADSFPGFPGSGRPVREEHVAIIGLRSVDAAERARLGNSRVLALTMKDIDRQGISAVAAKVIERLGGLGRVHVSFDADALDPRFAPGVGTPVPGGLTYREAHLLMELLSDAGIVTSLELVEVNPILDVANETARLMVELAASLLGRRII